MKKSVSLMETLNHLMSKNHITAYQLSKNTGLAQPTIKRLCTDPNYNPTLVSLTKIADFFGITKNQLLGSDFSTLNTPAYYPDFEKWSRVFILNEQQLSSWPSGIEEMNALDTTQYVLSDAIKDERSSFAIIVNNEALEPKFSKGTILIFDSNVEPKHKNLVMIKLRNHSIPQLKQILFDGMDVYLKSVYKDFLEIPPILFNRKNSLILGVLVQAKSTYI